MTNREKLQSMSDEQMAQFLIEVSYNACICCSKRIGGKRSCEGVHNCKSCITEWLNNPSGTPEPIGERHERVREKINFEITETI